MTTLNAPQLSIAELKHKYQLDNFVETGCYQGDGLDFAHSIGFTKLYSCDINESYVKQSRQRVPQAIISHQVSIDFLKDVIPTIQGSCLFWLDAHYPIYYGLASEDQLTRFPLLEEVQLICQLRDISRDVFVLDDLRVMSPEYNPFYNPSVGSEFMVNLKISDFIAQLSATHSYRLVDIDTGNIIFTPKI